MSRQSGIRCFLEVFQETKEITNGKELSKFRPVLKEGQIQEVGVSFQPHR